jgi:HK97 gp10 family phage protein
MSSSIELTGLEQIDRELSELGQVGKKMKKEILMKAGIYLQGKIKEAAPNEKPAEITTEENVKYGTLKDNIGVKWEKNSVKVHTGKAYWSVFLEHGYPGYAAQPFMENTFRENRDEIERIIIEEAKRKLGL